MRSGQAARIRRFPGLTREDVDVLRALAEDDPAKARAFERHLQREAQKRQRRFEESVLPCDSDLLDAISSREIARWQRGAGGGHKRQVEEVA